MKKLRSLLFLLLTLSCLTVSVSAWELPIDPATESNIEAEISEFPSISLFDGGIATYALEPQSTDDGFMLPTDNTYGTTFVKDTTARVSFVVEGCRSDQYIFAVLYDDSGNNYVTFMKKLSEINASTEDFHIVTLPIDLTKYGVPLGVHTLVYGVVDEKGEPVSGYFDALNFTVVSEAIPLESIAFYDAISGFDLTEFTLCPNEDNMLGLIYFPEDASGTREVVYQSSDESVFTVSNFGGYAVLEPVAPGTATLTATVNGTVTVSMPVSIGHDYALTETVTAATCTQTGTGIYQCSYCGDIKEVEIPATGHNFGDQEATVVQEPTACTPGKSVNFCLRCEADIELEIPAIFTDTESDRYYSSAVDYLYSNGIVTGMDPNASIFGTEISLTRGMLVTFLHRMAGSPDCDAETPFTDVESGRYFTTPIAWAYSVGIANGITDTTFEPMSEITRQQLAAFIYRYATNYRGMTLTEAADLSQFPDSDQLQTYAVDCVSWAVAAGIITGSSDDGVVTLQPLGTATRAQSATMLYRYLTYEAQSSETPGDTQDTEDTKTDDDDPNSENTGSGNSSSSDEPEQDPASDMVWVPTRSGEKYHTVQDCGGMKNPKYITLEQAIEQGFTPCKNCVKAT